MNLVEALVHQLKRREFEYFNMLPKELRDTMNYQECGFTPSRVYAMWKRVGLQRTLENIKYS